MSIVDVHSHIVTEDLIDALAASGMRNVPSFESDENGEVTLALGGRPKLGPIARTILDVDARVEEMDRLGVDTQVLAIAPMLFGYGEEPEVGAAMAVASNDCFIDIARSRPDRFNVFAGLPLAAPDAACAEIDRVASQPLVRGVQIGSHVHGTNLDDPSLEPVWDRLEQHDLAVLVHPYAVAGADRMKSHYLQNLIGNPLDSTIAIASLIFGGVAARHPGLRFCFVHGGGFAPYQIGRWDHGSRCRPEPRTGTSDSPSDLLARMYFDTLTHDQLALRFLGERVGWSHVVLGSDYPFDMATPDPVRAVRDLGLRPDDEHQVLEGNATRLLRPASVPVDLQVP